MPPGVRLALDVGTARIGVARSDPHGILASPVETVKRVANSEEHVRRILQLVVEHEPVEVLVGYPIALSGRETASTADAIELAEQLAEHVDVPVFLVDERLSTVTASAQLRSTGRSPSRSRDRIDQVAAVVILQQVLDANRSGRNPTLRRVPSSDSPGKEPRQ